MQKKKVNISTGYKVMAKLYNDTMCNPRDTDTGKETNTLLHLYPIMLQ